MARINHALIMAAGRGQRMMPLTQVLPKPMAPYLNSTLVADGIAMATLDGRTTQRVYHRRFHIQQVSAAQPPTTVSCAISMPRLSSSSGRAKSPGARRNSLNAPAKVEKANMQTANWGHPMQMPGVEALVDRIKMLENS